MQFNGVACKDGSLPFPKLVSIIRDDFDVPSNVDIRLYGRYGDSLSEIVMGDVSNILRGEDVSHHVYFVRS